MDQIQSMRAFIRVVEAGTFTKAADSLSLPKGTVTKQIQSLESRLRLKLLNRTTRRVTVTTDGAAYYERAARLINDLDDMESSMTNSQAAPQGRLRVDVGSSVARLVIIPALHTFYERFPDIQLHLGVSDRPADLMTENIDCVIRAGELSDQSLVARRIGNVGFATVATPQYLERFGVPRHPSEIEAMHYMVGYFSPRTNRIITQDFLKGSEHIDFIGRNRICVNESNAHIAATLAGLGVAQAVRFLADPHLRNNELIELLPEWERPPLPIYVVYPPNRHLSAKVRAFVDWAAELFSGLPHLQVERPMSDVARADSRASGVLT